MEIISKFVGGKFDGKMGRLQIPGPFRIGMEIALDDQVYVVQDGPAAKYFEKTQQEESNLAICCRIK